MSFDIPPTPFPLLADYLSPSTPLLLSPSKIPSLRMTEQSSFLRDTMRNGTVIPAVKPLGPGVTPIGLLTGVQSLKIKIML